MYKKNFPVEILPSGILFPPGIFLFHFYNNTKNSVQHRQQNHFFFTSR
nr:Nitrite reductase (NAD(P)H) large subunit [uncultured bacterium]